MSILRSGSRPTRTRKVLFALTAIVTAVGVSVPALASSGSAETTSAPWLNPSKSVSARVNSLLHAMTLQEKVGQMDQQLVTTVTDPNSATCGDNGFNLPNPACMQKILVAAARRIGAGRRHQQPDRHHG